MPNKLYSIKPLEWEQPTPNHWHARTNLFDYHVICMSLTQVELRCVGDAGTESEMFCKNILEA
jgi:hypothetical protein